MDGSVTFRVDELVADLRAVCEQAQAAQFDPNYRGLASQGELLERLLKRGQTLKGLIELCRFVQEQEDRIHAR